MADHNHVRGSVRLRLAWLAVALLACALLWPGAVAAGECSSRIGQATINEVHRQANHRFIEVKILNDGLNANVYNSWTVDYCSESHVDGRVCRSFALSAFEQSTYPWLTIDRALIPTANEINFAHPNDSGMEVRLNDAQGRAVDYLSVSGYTDIHEVSCGFLFDTTYTGPTNTHTIMRYEDGTGDWTIAGPGHSGGITEGDTNLEEDEDNPYPRLNIYNIEVEPGEQALFTVRLFDLDGNPITLGHNVTISYVTLDGEEEYGGATAPNYYTHTEGQAIIPAGQNTVTIAIDTFPGAVPDSFFYLVITGAVQANGEPVVLSNHFGIATFIEAEVELDHIRIEHSGALGVTCLTEPVTVRACPNEECDEPYPGDPVEVALTASGDGHFLANTVAVADQPVTVRLRKESASTTAIWATADEAENPTRCFIGGVEQGVGGCTVSFDDVGIVIDGDDSDGIVNSPILTQIAGKSSATGWNGAQQRIRVVRTDGETGACVAAVEDKTLEVTFSYGRPVAAEGLADNPMTVAGAAIASEGDEGTVMLTFDGNGTAPFSFLSQDAGRYTLSAALEIPVTDESGEPDPSGQTVHVATTSNPFVVRPLAVFADAAGNPRAEDADGGAFTGAGEGFTLTFKALRGDAESGGLWTGCTGSGLDDPGAGNYARVPAWNIGQPAAVLVKPGGGADPGLNYGDGDVAFPGAPVVHDVTVANVSFPEVGIIQFTAAEPDVAAVVDFLGEPVGICSPYIGRFVPDRFSVVPAPACGPFTWSGQPFGATVTALAVGGTTTLNYHYDDDLDEDEIFARGATLVDDGGAGSGILEGGGLAHDDFHEGVAVITDGDIPPLVYTFNPGDPDGDPEAYVPYDLVLRATDTDGVTGVSVAALEIRLGRLDLANAHGSELLSLPVAMRLLSWHDFGGGVFGWGVEEGDVCTVVGDGDVVDDNYQGGLTAVSYSVAPLDEGVGSIDVGAPGATGSTELTVDLDSAGAPWLKFDREAVSTLDRDGMALSCDDNPTACPTGRASFGVYDGSPRVIFRRELY